MGITPATDRTSVSGVVKPLLPDASVQVQRQDGAGWKTVATTTVTSYGAFTASLDLTPGTYRAPRARGQGVRRRHLAGPDGGPRVKRALALGAAGRGPRCAGCRHGGDAPERPARATPVVPRPRPGARHLRRGEAALPGAGRRDRLGHRPRASGAQRPDRRLAQLRRRFDDRRGRPRHVRRRRDRGDRRQRRRHRRARPAGTARRREGRQGRRDDLAEGRGEGDPLGREPARARDQPQPRQHARPGEPGQRRLLDGRGGWRSSSPYAAACSWSRPSGTATTHPRSRGPTRATRPRSRTCSAWAPTGAPAACRCSRTATTIYVDLAAPGMDIVSTLSAAADAELLRLPRTGLLALRHEGVPQRQRHLVLVAAGRRGRGAAAR